jgi:hypothetical protein
MTTSPYLADTCFMKLPHYRYYSEYQELELYRQPSRTCVESYYVGEILRTRVSRRV